MIRALRGASPPAQRRAAFLVLVAVAVAVACTFLGRWQWHRHVVRDALITTVKANWAAASVPLGELVPSVSDEPDDADEWRSVAVTGRYLPASQVLLRNRPVDGTPAYHVLVPFAVAGTGDVATAGALLVVDRGWVPLGDDGQSVSDVPTPPSGTVELVGRLRVPEAASDRGAPGGQVQSIDVPQVLAAGGLDAGTPAYRWYVGAVSETPAADVALGALPRPSTDPGPHLSYAFQWWAFALGGLLAFTWMARRELLDDLAAPAGSSVAAAAADSAAAAGPAGDGETARRRALAGATDAERCADLAGPGANGVPEPAVSAPVGPTPTGPPARGEPVRGEPTHGEGAPAESMPAGARRSRRRRGRDEEAEDALIDAQLGD